LPAGALSRLGTLRLKHLDWVACVAFTPDGKSLASGDDRGNLCIWDAKTGQEIRRLKSATNWIRHVAFAGDGNSIAAVAGFNTFFVVQIWDTRTGQELSRSGYIPAEESPILSPDLSVVAGQSACDAVGLWDTASGEEVRRFIGYPGADLSIVFAADGKTLAASSKAVGPPFDLARFSIYVWNTSSGEQVYERLSKETYFGPIAFGADARSLAWTEPGHRAVRIRDLDERTETILADRLPAEGTSTTAAASSSDGRYLATATSFDQRFGGEANGDHYWIQVWDIPARKLVRSLKGHRDEIRCLAFSPNGQTLASCGWDLTVRLWDLTTGKELLGGHRGAVRSLRFSPDGKLLATASDDHTVRLWDPVSGVEQAVLEGHRSMVWSIAFAPDGKTLASGSFDSSARLWNVCSGEEVLRLEGDKDRWIEHLDFSPNGKALAVASYHQGIDVWDLDGRTRLWPESAPGADPWKATFSPDGRLLACLAGLWGEPTILLRDSTTGKEVHRIVAAESVVTDVAFSPDGALLASASGRSLHGFVKDGERDSTIQIWETATGKERLLLRATPGTDNINAVVFSPNGRMLASGDEAGNVRLWEVATGEERARFVGHAGPVWGLAFSPDGKLLASGSGDTTALVLDATGRLALTDQLRNRPTAEELVALWADLEGPSAARAFRSMSRLVEAPEEAVALIREELKPVPGKALAEKELRRMISELEDDAFEVRENASRELARFGPPIRPALLKALEAGPGAEKRRRLKELLANLVDPPTPPELIRAIRALEVLETLGTRDSRQLLQALADGNPNVRLTFEAGAALRRLSER
jgi:WD40 repeat protein